MKELIKPNNRETQYSEIEGYCERGDGYYYSKCDSETIGDYQCIGRETTDDCVESEILF